MKSFLVGALCSFLFATSALSADLYTTQPIEPAPSQIVEKRWKFIVAPYLIAPTIQGHTEIGRLPATELDVSPSNIFKNLKFGGMGHFEVLYDDRFGAVFDIAYMDLGDDRTFPAVGGSVNAGFKQLISELFFGYRFYRSERAWAEAYAGARVWYNQIDVSASVPGNSFSTTLDEAWADPVIGLRGQVFLNDKWSLYGTGNIGGFNFGFASDFTWGAQGGVGYHFNDSVALQLHYKATAVDFDNDKSGIRNFQYDTITHGPLVGLVFNF
ncbi:hypothetical protein ABVF61_06060 [Roseibium sp. HPY-6]|uniref:outer membrane protein n=1 Tax=Roseibium sp. HPY-6 TaxID=3229852 RepID=UPI00338E94B6